MSFFDQSIFKGTCWAGGSRRTNNGYLVASLDTSHKYEPSSFVPCK